MIDTKDSVYRVDGKRTSRALGDSNKHSRFTYERSFDWQEQSLGKNSDRIKGINSISLLQCRFLSLEFEGERVPHLTKIDSKATTNQEEVKVDIEKEKDDYVLSKLFKKSGVHTALQHDTIVDHSVNDYVFIEAEAHRYAEEAVRALRKSSQDCYSAESGIPNWGGRNINQYVYI